MERLICDRKLFPMVRKKLVKESVNLVMLGIVPLQVRSLSLSWSQTEAGSTTTDGNGNRSIEISRWFCCDKDGRFLDDFVSDIMCHELIHASGIHGHGKDFTDAMELVNRKLGRHVTTELNNDNIPRNCQGRHFIGGVPLCGYVFHGNAHAYEVIGIDRGLIGTRDGYAIELRDESGNISKTNVDFAESCLSADEHERFSRLVTDSETAA